MDNHRFPSHLFSYGTLCLPEIISRVLGRGIDEGYPANLPHYGCYLVSGQHFPGIQPATGANTPGTLYADITREDLRRLDDYEGPLYQRQRMTVTRDNGDTVEAWCYTTHPAHQTTLSSLPWNLADFRQHHLDRFLDN